MFDGVLVAWRATAGRFSMSNFSPLCWTLGGHYRLHLITLIHDFLRLRIINPEAIIALSMFEDGSRREIAAPSSFFVTSRAGGKCP